MRGTRRAAPRASSAEATAVVSGRGSGGMPRVRMGPDHLFTGRARHRTALVGQSRGREEEETA